MVVLLCVIGVGLAGAIAVAFAGVAEAKSHHTPNYYGSTFGPQTPPAAIIRSSGGAHTSTPLKSSAGTLGSGGSSHAGGAKGAGTATGGTATGTGTGVGASSGSGSGTGSGGGTGGKSRAGSGG